MTVQSFLPELYNYIIAGVLFLIVASYVISTELSRLRKRYILTHTTIVKEEGLLIKDSRTYNLFEVQEIQLVRNVFGFIFNRGDIVLTFSTGGDLILENIKDPKSREKEILSVINENYSPDTEDLKLPDYFEGGRDEKK